MWKILKMFMMRVQMKKISMNSEAYNNKNSKLKTRRKGQDSLVDSIPNLIHK